MSCWNINSAQNSAHDLLSKKMSGVNSATKAKYIGLAEKIAGVIYKRFKSCPYGWKEKHLNWYLDHYLRKLSNKTKYDHYLVVRALAVALNKVDNWKKLKKGPWVRPSGKNGLIKQGRPPVKIS